MWQGFRRWQNVVQEAEAGHVIPRAVCPELQNQVMNLQLLPTSLKRAKSDKVTERVKVFAKELYEARLLLEEGWVGCQASPANSDCNLAHLGHMQPAYSWVRD
jgi:hypothetical protein